MGFSSFFLIIGAGQNKSHGDFPQSILKVTMARKSAYFTKSSL